MRLRLHLFIGMLEGVVLEDHRNQLLGHCLRKSFAKANAMTSKERGVCIRMARLPIRGLKVLGSRIEALWDIFVVPGAPLAFIVMHQAHHDMDLVTRLNSELFLGSFGKDDILGDSVRSREVCRSLHTHGLLEAHHSIFEVVLDVVIVASFKQFLLVDLSALGVPNFKRQLLINFRHQLLLDRLVLVHMHVLHQVVHGNLGCVRRCEVDRLDIVEQLTIGLVFAIDFSALRKKNREEVRANLSLPDLFKLFVSDLLEKRDDRAIILAEDLVPGRDIVREQLSEEQVQSLHVAHNSILQDHTKELAQRKHLSLTRLVMLERQFLVGIFFSKGDGEDELPLDLH